MSNGLLMQYIVLALIVAVSALVVFRKLAPQLTNRWLAAASIRLLRHESRLARMLGRRLQPKQATGNCADGCATCGACGPKKPAAVAPASAASRGPDTSGHARMAVEPIPLHFRPRSH